MSFSGVDVRDGLTTTSVAHHISRSCPSPAEFALSNQLAMMIPLTPFRPSVRGFAVLVSIFVLGWSCPLQSSLLICNNYPASRLVINSVIWLEGKAERCPLWNVIIAGHFSILSIAICDSMIEGRSIISNVLNLLHGNTFKMTLIHEYESYHLL